MYLRGNIGEFLYNKIVLLFVYFDGDEMYKFFFFFVVNFFMVIDFKIKIKWVYYKFVDFSLRKAKQKNHIFNR